MRLDTNPEIVRDLLLLIDLDVPLETIRGWTEENRAAAMSCAAYVHLAASDNIVRVPTMPACLAGVGMGA